jgi:hypothetical protein
LTEQKNTALLDLLTGGDRRSLGKSEAVYQSVSDQRSFDDLFQYIFHEDRVVSMRSIDAIEKITLNEPGYLQVHKDELLALLNKKSPSEVKWHLPLLIVRLDLSEEEAGKVWETLTVWTLNKQESRIVRVHSIQALYDLLKIYPNLKSDFNLIVEELQRSGIPSIIARLKRFK